MTHHLPLLFTVKQVIVVLHGDKLVPSVLFRNILQSLELPGGHGTRTNIPHPALLDDIVQCLHYLLSGCVAVQTMDLQDIDVGAQSLHALLDRVEDVLAAQTDSVDHVAVVGGACGDGDGGVFFLHAKVAFGEDDDFVAGDVVLLESLSDDLLGVAVGVDVGLTMLDLLKNLYKIAYGIPGVDAALVGVLEKRQTLRLIQDPWLPL